MKGVRRTLSFMLQFPGEIVLGVGYRYRLKQDYWIFCAEEIEKLREKWTTAIQLSKYFHAARAKFKGDLHDDELFSTSVCVCFFEFRPSPYGVLLALK